MLTGGCMSKQDDEVLLKKIKSNVREGTSDENVTNEVVKFFSDRQKKIQEIERRALSKLRSRKK